MAAINTVGGRLDSAELGRTLVHEHVMVGFPGWWLDPRRPRFQRDEAMSRVVDAFAQLRDFGVRTVIDPCPMDMGRNVEFCAEVSQKTGVNLICATGVYYEKAGCAYVFQSMSVEEIADIYVQEIEQGVGNSGIRPGVIKIATGAGAVSDFERKVLTAAGRAARQTGVPVLSHTENCTCGHEQIDIVTAEGVPAGRMLVGHIDGRDDPDYQRSLAERGVYVGFDRFGLDRLNLGRGADQKPEKAGGRWAPRPCHGVAKTRSSACWEGCPATSRSTIYAISSRTHASPTCLRTSFRSSVGWECQSRTWTTIVEANPRRYFECSQGHA